MLVPRTVTQSLTMRVNAGLKMKRKLPPNRGTWRVATGGRISAKFAVSIRGDLKAFGGELRDCEVTNMKALAEQISELDGTEIYGRVVGVRGLMVEVAGPLFAMSVGARVMIETGRRGIPARWSALLALTHC